MPSAALRWLAWWKPGGHIAPRMWALARMYEADAAKHGWRVDCMTPRSMRDALVRLGFTLRIRNGAPHATVDKATAQALWAVAPPGSIRPRHVPKRRPTRAHTRMEAPPFHPVQPSHRPVVDVWGAVYPSVRVAARLVRIAPARLSQALHRRQTCVGRAWRYLSPREVGCVPPTARAGERVVALAWDSTVSVHCPGCRCGSSSSTPTQDSHPTPLVTPTRGDPHT